jgi:Protein of unknown function (DUF2877)
MREMPATAVRPRTAPASQASTALLARLAGPRRGRIHSVYRSAINVMLPPGDLIVIADPPLGGLPNGVLVDLGPDHCRLGLDPDQLVLLDARSIVVPAIGLRIALDSAVSWSPRLPVPDRGAGPRWRHRAHDVRAFAAARTVAAAGSASEGLGGLLAGVRPRRLPIHAARTAAVLDQLAAALPSGDVDAAGRVARRLVGLGPGLTPSGDDALIGLAAALQAMRHPARGFLDEAIDDVALRTTVVAATFLRHAAAGEFSERLQRLIAALLGDKDAAVAPAIEGAMAWGATSGTDCLVGVLFGLDLAAAPVEHPAALAR